MTEVEKTIEAVIVNSKLRVAQSKKCLFCSEKFDYVSYAKGHMAISHVGAQIANKYVKKLGPEQYKCEVCGLILKSKTGVKGHLGRTHDKVLDEIIAEYAKDDKANGLVNYSDSEDDKVG